MVWTAATWLAWGLSIAVILLIVLPRDLQDHAHWGKVQWVPFITPPIKRIDLIGNVLLYMPFGFLGGKSVPGGRSPWTIVAAAAVLSLSTEAIQLFSHARYPSATDIVCNVTGCLAGLYGALPSRRRSAFLFSQEIRS